MTTSDSINELAAALAKAQGEMGDAVRACDNATFGSRYADLSSVWEACRAPLAKHEIAIVQSPSTEGARVSVVTLLTHRSGQWLRGTISVTACDDSPQAVGSACTYLRRYALQAFAGVAPADDDAEAAQGRGKHPDKNAIGIRTLADGAPKPAPLTHLEWVDTLRAVAPEGTRALNRVWYAAPAGFQRQLLQEAPDLWETLRAIAALQVVA